MYIIIEEGLKKINEEYKEYNRSSLGEESNYFGPLNKINLFVGANNSGKSRLLRILLNCNNFTLTNFSNLDILKGCLLKEKERLSGIDNSFKIHLPRNNNRISVKELPIYIKDFVESTSHGKETVIQTNSIIKEIDSLIERLSNYLIDLEFKIVLKTYIGKYKVLLDFLEFKKSSEFQKFFEPQIPIFRNDSPTFLTLVDSLKILIKVFIEIEKIEIQKPQPHKSYIPLLRSAISIYGKRPGENVKKIAEDIYEYTTRKNYRLNDDIEIETGRNLYKNIRRVRNDFKYIRDEFEKFEKFLSESFFDGKRVDIVARDTEDPNEAHINIFIDEDERDIHDLGDGIQSLIIIMFKIFTAKPGSWIFIEEPEITLHPGFQRIFLDQLLKNKDFEEKELKFFISTHSNHLLDLSLESKSHISIFSFERKQHKGVSYNSFKNVKNNDVDILNTLGVRNSSVFLANCSIWVEGHTDAKYISAYLKAYIAEKELPSFKEDIQYSFYIYGGSNISHYLFSEDAETDELLEKDKIKAQFLSNRIFLVADQDEGKENKHLKLLKQENSFFKYHKLPLREIENLLSVKQLKSFLPEISKIKMEKLNSAELFEQEYAEQYLGSYLSEKLGPENIPKGLADKSGTLSTYYKNKLSETAKEKMKWSEMGSPAKELAKEVYEFIYNHNT